MVDHQIHDDAHAQLVGALDQRVEGCEIAEQRVDVAIVGNVVPVVSLRRAIDGGDPHDIDTQVGQVIEALVNSRQISDPVAVRILEGTRIHLVEDCVHPPRVGVDTSGGQEIGAQNHRGPRGGDQAEASGSSCACVLSTSSEDAGSCALLVVTTSSKK